jgi:primosomal protein N' (replication factor Y) (superfamily II helicase)
LKFLGSGTEKLEQEVKLTIPGARVLRWDSDTAPKASDHAAILKRFMTHEADILIGTQMVAKGLDLPLVTLVGIISIDDSLNLPDFRAGERAFQLMSQVAGRAGRGPRGGQVIIQTYVPTHYAIRAAATHDYLAFYQRELAYRRALREPPFSALVRLTCSHSQDDLCLKEALHLKRRLGLLAQSPTGEGIDILGPAPAFIHRLRGNYRWQLVLRGSRPAALLRGLALSRNWTIDVDPVGLD